MALDSRHHAGLLKRILSGSAMITLVTLAGRAVAMLKDIVIASYFGSGAVLDSFLLALMLPSLFMLIFFGPFQAAFLPTRSRLEGQGRQRRAKLLYRRVMGGLWSLCLLFAALWALGYPWLGPVLLPHSSGSLMLLGLWALPAALAIANTSQLNAEGLFYWGAGLPVLSSVGMMLNLWLWGQGGQIDVLVWGALTGAWLEAGAGLWLLHRRRWPVGPVRPTIQREERRLWAQYRPLLGSTVLLNSWPFIDNLMAATLAAGAVSALNYGVKIPTVLMTVLCTGVYTILLPEVSRHFAEGQIEQIRGLLRRLLPWVLAAACAVMLLALLATPWLVPVLFERGAFDAEDSQRVQWIQMAYLLQLPFAALGRIAALICTASENNRALLLVAWQTLLLNVVFNLALMPFLGAAGIALSTSLTAMASCARLGWLARRALRGEKI